MSIYVQYLCEYVFISLGHIPRNGISRSYGNMINISKNCQIVFQTSYIIYEGSPCQCVRFLISPQALVFICLFDYSHSSLVEVESHCCLDLHFLDDQYWVFFHVLIGTWRLLYTFFGKKFIQILCLFWKLGCLF